MNVKVLTMHAAHNYGAVLQTYATQHVIEKKFGESCEILNYVSTQRQFSRYMTKVIDRYKHSKLLSALFVARVFPERSINHLVFSSFLKRRIHVGKVLYKSAAELKAANISADVFCVGSDQVWNPKHNDGIDEGYFLDFVGENGKKISYSSSMALRELEPQYKQEVKKLLESFSHVSYRELGTREVMDDLGIKSCCTLDPSLLLTAAEWDAFAGKQKKIEEPYLLLYWFGNTGRVIQKARELAKANGLRVVRISVGFEKYDGDDIVLRFISPERFVSLFSNASMVVTNSFHGTAFSINYNKQFYTSFSPELLDERFNSILTMFDLHSRNIHGVENVESLGSIDYNRVNEKVKELRDFSLSYFEKALYE